jgi:thiamine transporter ThiT
MLAAVPSLVLAFRRGTRADWLAAVIFTAVNVAWLADVMLTPVETHGLQFVADVLLLLAATVGAALHCLLSRSSVSDPR